MTIYYVDDGGSATAPYDTWAKAATSLSALDDAVTFASGDIVYIGHDHVCQYTHAASRTITGPTSWLPTIIISATTGSSPPTYQESATNQIDTSEGAYSLTFDGSFALYGVRMSGMTNLYMGSDENESMYMRNCTIALAANGQFSATRVSRGASYVVDCVIDLTADGTSTRTQPVLGGEYSGVDVNGLTFVNAAYRTGTVFLNFVNDRGVIRLSGVDVSGFSHATDCEIFNPNSFTEVIATNIRTKVGYTLFSAGGVASPTGKYCVTNVGPTDAPEALHYKDYFGDVVSSSVISRTGGAQVEGASCAWLITTTANCSEASPLYTPWIYGKLATAGSKTFDLYITNDTADLTDAEIWLEVEYHATADDPRRTLATDQRATITTTAAAQTDDTASTWTGAGPAYTYKQRLRVTATVGEEGVYRARVAFGVTSMASSRYCYVDPKVTVS